MPQSKQAEKHTRIALQRQMKNRAVRSRTKTFITRAEKLIFTGEMEPSATAVAESISALDRAVEKGIIPNNAARRKSRLMKKFNQAQASAAEVLMEEVAEVEEVAEKAEEKPKAEKKPKAAKKPKAEKKAKSK